MKNLFLAFAFLSFISLGSIAAIANPSAEIVFCEGDKKCDKKDCKGKKQCSAKKACCKKGEAKKECSKDAHAKKACCKKGETKKECSAKKASTEKNDEK